MGLMTRHGRWRLVTVLTAAGASFYNTPVTTGCNRRTFVNPSLSIRWYSFSTAVQAASPSHPTPQPEAAPDRSSQPGRLRGRVHVPDNSDHLLPTFDKISGRCPKCVGLLIVFVGRFSRFCASRAIGSLCEVFLLSMVLLVTFCNQVSRGRGLHFVWGQLHFVRGYIL